MSVALFCHITWCCKKFQSLELADLEKKNNNLAHCLLSSVYVCPYEKSLEVC